MPILEPRPITSRSLFDLPEGSTRAVRIGSGHSDWYQYAAGYKLAADRLVYGLRDHGPHTDFVCIPILFLYRHYVELYLKALLLDLGELLDSPSQVPDRHPLLPLWRSVRRHLTEMDRGNESAWNDRAENLIQELDSLDPGSFTFRYPTDLTGKPTLMPAREIDIGHFRDVIAELHHVLGGADSYVTQHLQLKRDYEQDFDDPGLYYSY